MIKILNKVKSLIIGPKPVEIDDETKYDKVSVYLANNYALTSLIGTGLGLAAGLPPGLIYRFTLY